MTPRVRLYAALEGAKYGLTIEQVLSECRLRPYVRARWGVMRRLRDDGFTLTQIGAWIGRDHATVFHGLKHAA